MSSIQLKAKAQEAYRTISEVAEELDLPQHVLRFWETRFSQIKPMKRAGGRRFYRLEDVELIKGIRTFLYGEGYTIRGLQKIIKDNGVAHVAAVGRGEASVEKPKGVEQVEVVSEANRTRDRYEQKLEAKERAEFAKEERVHAPVFARHLMETLNDSFSKPEPKQILKEETKPMQSVYALKTSYSSQPLVIPPQTDAVSIGRGLSQPMKTQNPSPLVKFRPIEELPEELPAFVKERKFTAIEPQRREELIRRDEPVFRAREPQSRNHRLHSALLELNECKRILSQAQ